MKKDTCAETKAYLSLLEKAVPLVLNLPLLAARSRNAMLQQSSHESKSASRPFMGESKNTQSSKWLSKPEWGCSVQGAPSVPEKLHNGEL